MVLALIYNQLSKAYLMNDQDYTIQCVKGVLFPNPRASHVYICCPHGLIECPFFKPKWFSSMHHSDNWDDMCPVLVINERQSKGTEQVWLLSLCLSPSICVSLSQSVTDSPLLLIHCPMWLWEMNTNVNVCVLNSLIWVHEGIYVLCVIVLRSWSVTIYPTELWVFGFFFLTFQAWL